MFYSDTFFLMPFGIYVWGDGLVLAPFWFVASIIFWFLSIKQVVVFLLVFWVIRSGFEVIYWLNHQSVNNDFNPPMLRKVKWLDAGKSAILYQLLHTTIIILGVIGILFTK